MRLGRTWLVSLIAGAGLITIGAAAAPAGAEGTGCCTLQLVPSRPTGTVGVAYTFNATGTVNPVTAVEDLAVYAIPATYTTTCPAGYLTALQLTGQPGAQPVVTFEVETVDANGDFSMPVVYTPSQPGQWLFCAYSNEGGGLTDALSSAIVTFQANGGGGGGGGHGAVGPANTAKPRVTRSGNQLRCTRGRWADSPTRFAYRWLVGGTAKADATGSTLAITHRLRGHKIQCVVQASNASGSTSARSAPLIVH